MKQGKRSVKKTKVKAIKGKKQNAIKKVIIAVIAIIITFLVILFLSNEIVLDKNKKTNLVINNNNVTINLKNDIIIEDDVIYLSKQDIANFFDKYIYEDESTNQIITTYDKKIATIGFDENTININGSNKQIYAHAIKRDNIIYLPISEMHDVYDVEIENIEYSKVITMDSLSKEKKNAILKSNVSVKSSTNLISKTVDKIKKGSSVTIISNNGKYSKIRTENGKIGYIKSNKLQNEYLVRENMPEEKQVSGKINLTWDYFSSYGSAPDRSGQTIDGVNVVSPAFFYIDENGNFKENVGDSGKKYIEWAHNNGYKVWPMVSNAEAAAEDLNITSKIMNNYKIRQKLIETIVNMCVKYDLDGINIDFENMKKEDKDMYSRFIIELTPRLKEIGLVTSVDVTAPDGADTWSLCFDRNVIGDVADYIIFMAYDEYGVSSTKPGTTAGYDWVKLSLNKFLQTEEIEADKIVLAIPLYTRVWTTKSDGSTTSTTVAMKNIDKNIPDDAEKKWDDDLKQNYVEFTKDGNKKQIWIEDLESLKYKISLINENNLAGIASWQKDMEVDEVWSLINKELSK